MDHLTSLDRGDGPATGTNGLLRLLAENSLAQLLSLPTHLRLELLDKTVDLVPASKRAVEYRLD
jgi:hypothetical protein